MSGEGENQNLQEAPLERSAKKKGKIFFVVGASIIILILFYLSIAKYDLKGSLTGKVTDGGLQEEAIISVSTDDDPVLGNKDAPVTIVEFSDFQCPFCGAAEPAVAQIMSTYKGKVRLVYMHFPLTSIHPYAEKAAEAAECAYDQGKFWELHGKMFANQNALGVDQLKGYAKDIGLDTAKFNTCLDSNQKQAQVNSDQQKGSSYGVGGTPTFFINGIPVVGALPFSEFKSVIDAELAGK